MSEFKNLSYIETGDVNVSFDATSFNNGDVLDFHKASPDLKPYAPHDAMMHEARNFAIETPAQPENIFEKIGETALAKLLLSGEKTERLRRAEATGEELDAFVVRSMQRKQQLTQQDFEAAA